MRMMNVCPMANESHLSVIKSTQQVRFAKPLECPPTHIPMSLCIAFSRINIKPLKGGTIPENLYVPGHPYIVGSTEYQVSTWNK